MAQDDPRTTRARQIAGARYGFRWPLAIYVIVSAGSVTGWLLTGKGFLWALFPLLVALLYRAAVTQGWVRGPTKFGTRLGTRKSALLYSGLLMLPATIVLIAVGSVLGAEPRGAALLLEMLGVGWLVAWLLTYAVIEFVLRSLRARDARRT